jgi:membrane protein
MQFIRDAGEAIAAFMRHDGPIMAGHLAFLGLLGLFPFIIFLVAIASVFGQTDAGIDAITFVFDHIPEEVANVLRDPVADLLYSPKKGGVLTLSLLGSVWAASAVLGTVRLAVDRAYEAGSPPAFWLRRLHGIGLVVISTVAIVLGMSLVVLGPLLWEIATDFVPVLNSWAPLFDAVRIGASTLVFFIALCGLHFSLKPRFRGFFAPVVRGSFLTLLLWVAAGVGFSYYLKYVGSYAAYGSMAGAIIALVFFYVLNAAFLLGAELNAVAARRLHPDHPPPAPEAEPQD